MSRAIKVLIELTAPCPETAYRPATSARLTKWEADEIGGQSFCGASLASFMDACSEFVLARDESLHLLL